MSRPPAEEGDGRGEEEKRPKHAGPRVLTAQERDLENPGRCPDAPPAAEVRIIIEAQKATTVTADKSPCAMRCPKSSPGVQRSCACVVVAFFLKGQWQELVCQRARGV